MDRSFPSHCTTRGTTHNPSHGQNARRSHGVQSSPIVITVTTRSFSLADCFSLAFPRIAATLAQGNKQQCCTGNHSTPQEMEVGEAASSSAFKRRRSPRKPLRKIGTISAQRAPRKPCPPTFASHLNPP